MRFTIRDLLWMTAVVAIALSSWLDGRRRDYSVRSAQLRKDYYELMAEVARAETEKAQQMQQQLAEALKKQREKDTP